MASSKREQVLKCARELFEREGFHATGVDRILEKAGVAKMTLYNNFGSKDQLIVEVLNQSSEIMIGRMKEHALAASNDSYEQILAIFRTLGDSYQDPDFCGCTKAGLKNPEELSRKLALLSSGASCVARQTKARTPADDALCIAEILLERASN